MTCLVENVSLSQGWDINTKKWKFWTSNQHERGSGDYICMVLYLYCTFPVEILVFLIWKLNCSPFLCPNHMIITVFNTSFCFILWMSLQNTLLVSLKPFLALGDLLFAFGHFRGSCCLLISILICVCLFPSAASVCTLLSDVSSLPL